MYTVYLFQLSLDSCILGACACACVSCDAYSYCCMFGNLNQLLAKIKPFIEQNRNSSVLGVDIGTSSIKLVQLRKDKGVIVLETYGEIALGPFGGEEIGQATNLQPDKIAEAIKDLMREANVTATVCGASVPFASSLVRLIELPPLTGNKLASMIPIEARKYIPVPINEVQLDWFVVPQAELHYFQEQQSAEGVAPDPRDEKALVLLVAIHNEVLRKYTDAYKFAGITPAFYEIEIFSTIRATVERSMAPVAIIDIGAATTKVYIVELGVVVSSHVISKGSQHVTFSISNTSHVTFNKAEELKRTLSLADKKGQGTTSHAATLVMDYIFIEARRVLLAYQQKQNKVISKVVLTGGGATGVGLRDFAYRQLELPLEIADPFSHTQAPAFMENVLKTAGPSFSVAIGLALRKLQEMG